MPSRQVLWILLTVYLSLLSQFAWAAPFVSGRIFVDFDRDGRYDWGEDADAILDGLSVQAFDSTGALVASTTTAVDGSYSLDVGASASTDVRIEFEIPKTATGAGRDYWPTFGGQLGISQSESSSPIRFIDATSDVADVRFGIVPESECPTIETGAGTDRNPGGATNSWLGKVFTTCWVNGSIADGTGPQDVLVSVTADPNTWLDPDGWATATDPNAVSGGNGDGEHLGFKSDIGASWGVAYDEWHGTLFTSAVVKRHADLGPEGVDGLYWLSYVNGAGGFNPTVNSVSLDSLSPGGTPSFGADPIECPKDGGGNWNYSAWSPADPSWDCRDLGNAADPSHDFWGFDKTGRHGIGDIDLTPDGKTLLVMNATSEIVFEYDVSTVSAGGNPIYRRHHPVNDPGCSNGEFESWAVKAIDGNSAYIGVTCTADTSQNVADVIGHIVLLDLSSSTQTPQVAIPFDYDHGCAYTATCGPDNGDFHAWISDMPSVTAMSSPKLRWDGAGYVYAEEFEYHQPLLSDIAIDDYDGSLAVGVISRWSMQMGFTNCDIDPSSPDWNHGCAAVMPAPPVDDYDGDGVDDPVLPQQAYISGLSGGELLRVCNTSGDPDAPALVLEGDPACDPSAFSPSFSVPHGGGPAGSFEWYWNDQMGSWPGTSNIHPEASQGGVYIGDRNSRVTYSSLNASTAFGGGLSWDQNADGAHDMAFQLFRSSTSGLWAGDPLFFKSASIGDVEGCVVPMQIGNYVWFDTDGDGIQDPGELPLQGVQVELLDAIGNPVLDQSGNPIVAVTDVNGHYYFEQGVVPNTSYQIRFDVSAVTNLPAGASASDLTETKVDANADSEDWRDSDIVGGIISMTTGGPGQNDHTVGAGFTLPYDLALIKTVTAITPAPAKLGSDITFTITVMNQGAVASGSFSVEDVLPAGLGFVSAAPTPTGNPAVGASGTVQWVVPVGGELAPGATTTFEVVARVVDITLSPFRNIADIVADSGDDDDSTAGDNSGASDTFDDTDVTNDSDPGDQDDSDFTEVVVVPEYDLALIKQQKSLSASPPTLGTLVTYEITVMNQGDLPSGSFTVTDTIPPGLTFVSATPAATSDPGAGATGPVQWVVATANELAAAAQTTFEVTLAVADVTLSPYRNVAEITMDSGADDDSTPADGSGLSDTFDDNDVTNDNDPADQDDSDFSQLSVTAEYDLSLVKQTLSVTPTPVANGTQAVYEITVMNQGNVPSGAFTVTDSIPAGMNFVSATPAATTDPGVGANGPVTWLIPVANELAPGATATFQLVAQIADSLSTPFRNEAEITADSGAAYGGDDDSSPGDGSAATDTFDDNDVSNDQDPADSDDSDFEVLTADGYDLALVKEFVSVAPAPTELGSVVTFSIDVVNQGGIASGAFAFSDVLPAPLAFVQAVPAPTSDPGVGNNGTLSWSVPAASELLPGQSLTVTVMAQVIDTSVPGTFRNEAEITSDSSAAFGGDEDSVAGDGSGSSDSFDDSDPDNDNDPGDQDDSDFAPIEILPEYDLSLEKSLDPQQPLWVVQGQSVNYDVVVTNEGNVATATFSVVDTIPAGMSYVSASGPNFVCTPDSPAAGLVQCDYTPATGTDLAPSQSVQIDIGLRVDDMSQAPFTNHVEITSDSASDFGLTDTDSTPGTNTGSDNGPGEGSPGENQDDASTAIIRAASSTPITLKTFASQFDDGRLRIWWSTSMEDGNQGFLIYGRVADGQWQRLNADLIPTKALDSNGAGYAIELSTDKAWAELTLTDVDLYGSEVVHGPFKVNASFGEIDVTGDVSSRRSAVEPSIDTRRGSIRPAGVETDSLYLIVREAGVHRVSYKSLRDAGVDLRRVGINDLALTHRDQAVPIRVRASAELSERLGRQVFGAGGWIEFVAEAVDSPYTQENVYRLQVDPANARRIDVLQERGQAGQIRTSAEHVHEWAPNRHYSRVAPDGDPWYAMKLSAINVPVTRTLKLPLTDLVANTGGAIEVDLWAATDNPRLDGDHRIRVKVNGKRVASRVFDGVKRITLKADLDTGTLVAGTNTVTLELPLSPQTRVDTIVVDAIRIRYQRYLDAQRTTLAIQSDGQGSYRSRRHSSRDVVVYRLDPDGSIKRILAPMKRTQGGYTLLFGRAAPVGTRYFVAGRDQRRQPTLRRVPKFEVKADPRNYNYVVIAHPRFMTADLESLIQAREAQGHTVRLVNLDTVYAKYSGGIVDPEAIRSFIAESRASHGTRMVLLVGGDTYDYKHNLDTGPPARRTLARSYIPSLYGRTGQAVRHAPVDPLYGDVDKDGVPEVVVGRLPVQTPADLRVLVDKILGYARTADRNAVFISDKRDAGTRRSFANMGRRARAQLKGWDVDLISGEQLNAPQVRSRFRRAVDEGRSLTVYFGHSDLNDWGFGGLVRRSDVRRLVNHSDPTAVLQFGCWNTYYVSPGANTLAHQWLLDGGHGAAMVMGATTLSDAGSEQQFANLILKGLSGGKSYGESVHRARRSMVQRYGLESVKDLVGGFVILGDPAMMPPQRR